MHAPFYAALTFLLALSFSAPALAQTTPTAHETQVGDSCSKASHGSDFDTLVQCSSTSSTSGTFQKAPIFAGEVTSPPYTATTCDSGKAGMIQYTSSSFQGCDGSDWSTFGNGTNLTIPSGVILTGNIHGFDYSITGTNQITVTAGVAMDSTNTVELSMSSATALSIGTTASTVYNVFICRNSSTEAVGPYADTAVDGSGISGVDACRWIGFVLNDSAGDLYSFVQAGDKIRWAEGIALGSASGSSWTNYSITSFVPISRVYTVDVWNKNDSAGYFFVGQSSESASNNAVMFGAYEPKTQLWAEVIPDGNNVYIRSGTYAPQLRGARMRR